MSVSDLGDVGRVGSLGGVEGVGRTWVAAMAGPAGHLGSLAGGAVVQDCAAPCRRQLERHWADGGEARDAPLPAAPMPGRAARPGLQPRRPVPPATYGRPEHRGLKRDRQGCGA